MISIEKAIKIIGVCTLALVLLSTACFIVAIASNKNEFWNYGLIAFASSVLTTILLVVIIIVKGL